MTTTPVPIASPPADTAPSSGEPSWLVKAIGVAVMVIPAVIAFVNPGGRLSAPSLVAAVTLGGLLVGAVIVLVDTIAKNGMSKAGLERTVSEEEAWFRANYATIRSTFEAAKPALDAIPGVPAALDAVTKDVADLKARAATVPSTDVSAIEGVVRQLVPQLVIPNVLAAPAAAAAPPEAPPAPAPAPAVSP